MTLKKIFVVNYHNTYGKFKKNFEWQINFFEKYFTIINFNDLKKMNKSKIATAKKPFLLITFDDGHKSNFEMTKEILDPKKIKAIFFIPPNFINYAWPKDIKKQCLISTNKFNIPCISKYEIQDKKNGVYMPWNEIIKLKKSGHTIGCHGMNHIRLSKKLSKVQLYDEIFKSKYFLEKKLKIKIESFCWVGGERWAYSSKAHKMIKEANYKYSFMTCAKPYDPIKDDRFKIHRFNIENSFSKNRVRLTVSIIYSLVYAFKRKYINQIL